MRPSVPTRTHGWKPVAALLLVLAVLIGGGVLIYRTVAAFYFKPVYPLSKIKDTGDYRLLIRWYAEQQKDKVLVRTPIFLTVDSDDALRAAAPDFCLTRRAPVGTAAGTCTADLLLLRDGKLVKAWGLLCDFATDPAQADLASHVRSQTEVTWRGLDEQLVLLPQSEGEALLQSCGYTR